MGAVYLTEAHFGQLFQEEGTFANETGLLDGANYNNSPPSLVMDYVYRGPLLEGGGKVIMRPENVKYTSHAISALPRIMASNKLQYRQRELSSMHSAGRDGKPHFVSNNLTWHSSLVDVAGCVGCLPD